MKSAGGLQRSCEDASQNNNNDMIEAPFWAHLIVAQSVIDDGGRWLCQFRDSNVQNTTGDSIICIDCVAKSGTLFEMNF